MLLVAIVIILTPADAKKRGGGHDKGGHGNDHGQSHGGGHGGHDKGDDGKGDDHGGHNGGPSGPGPNGGPSSGADSGGGNGCNPNTGVDNPECPIREARPSIRIRIISPYITQYINAFGQVIGTTVFEPNSEVTAMSAMSGVSIDVPETQPKLPDVAETSVTPETSPNPPNIAVVKTPQPPPRQLAKETSVVIDMLVLQALTRDVPRETIPEPALIECIPPQNAPLP